MNATKTRRRLPPGGVAVRDMIRARMRPKLFGGAIIVSLDWKLARHWPLTVTMPLDMDSAQFDVSYLRNVEVLVIHRPDHPAEHVAAVLKVLHSVPTRLAWSVALPRYT